MAADSLSSETRWTRCGIFKPMTSSYQEPEQGSSYRMNWWANLKKMLENRIQEKIQKGVDKVSGWI